MKERGGEREREREREREGGGWGGGGKKRKGKERHAVESFFQLKFYFLQLFFIYIGPDS